MQNEERQHRHARPRLETLSDLIYGLSLSIGAISLVITNSTQSNAIDIDRNILEFLFVFLILITSWIIYTSSVPDQYTRCAKLCIDPVHVRLFRFLVHNGWVCAFDRAGRGTARPRGSDDTVSKNPKPTNNPDLHSSLLHRTTLGLAPPRSTRQTLDRACANRLILVQPNETGTLRNSPHTEIRLEPYSVRNRE